MGKFRDSDSRMDKYEYEERYGEKVIYCTRHYRSDIDSCAACDEEEREDEEPVSICVTCRYESAEDEFITVEIKRTGESSLVCQSCYDEYRKEADMVHLTGQHGCYNNKERNFLCAACKEEREDKELEAFLRTGLTRNSE